MIGWCGGVLLEPSISSILGTTADVPYHIVTWCIA